MLFPVAAMLQPFIAQTDARAELQDFFGRVRRLERRDEMRGPPEMMEDHGPRAVEDDHAG